MPRQGKLGWRRIIVTTHSSVPKIEMFRGQMAALHYQALFDFAPFGYIVTDPDGVIRQVNQAAASLLNAHQDRLAGKPVLHFVAQDDREELCSHLAQMAQHACVQDWEVCLQPRAKAPFAAAVTLAAVYDPVEGTLVGLCWIIRDATARPPAGEALHQAHGACEPRGTAHTAALTTANEQLAQRLKELRGAREAMAERLRFEALLAGLSTRFLNVSVHVDQEIARGLQQVAEFLTIDRGTLLAFSEDTTQLRARHAWTAPGFDSPPPLLPFD